MQWCSQRFDGGGCGGDGDDGGNGEGKNIMMIDTNNYDDDDNSSDKKNLWRRAEPSRNILFQLCLLPHTHIFPERTVELTMRMEMVMMVKKEMLSKMSIDLVGFFSGLNAQGTWKSKHW